MSYKSSFCNVYYYVVTLKNFYLLFEIIHIGTNSYKYTNSFGYFCKNTMLLRIFSFLGEGMWLVYGLLGGSIQLAISGTIALTSLTIGIIRELRAKRQAKQSPVLEKMD